MCEEIRQPEMGRLRRKKPTDRFFKVRNVLNIIFLLGAVAGIAVYYLHNHTVGIIVILISMIFKMAECCLRFSKR